MVKIETGSCILKCVTCFQTLSQVLQLSQKSVPSKVSNALTCFSQVSQGANAKLVQGSDQGHGRDQVQTQKKVIAKVQKSKEIFSGTLTNSFAWTSKTWKPMLDFLCLSLIVMERKAINTGSETLFDFKGKYFDNYVHFSGTTVPMEE